MLQEEYKKENEKIKKMSHFSCKMGLDIREAGLVN